jgi:hypothetical protein
MEASEEIRSLLRSLIDSWGTTRMWPVFDDAISTDDGTLLIGTDPSEWWQEQSDLRRVLKAQSEELQGSQATPSRIDAWSEGVVGWGAAQFEIAFPGVAAASARLTMTFAQRPEGWKVVQGHFSVGVANEDLFKELTV